MRSALFGLLGALAACAVAFGASPGQALVSGRLVTADALPLGDGYVSLATTAGQPVSAAATDARGQFVLRGLSAGTYVLQIAAPGRESRSIELLIGDKNDIYSLGDLVVGNDELAEVLVEGERANTLDRRSYDLGESAAQATGSLLDAMRALPGVTVDPEGRVLLRGSDRVAILIDGKPSGLVGYGDQRGLDSIPAANAARIEIINNPSARYDAAGMAGVINIVYARQAPSGWSGDVSLALRTGRLSVSRADLPTELGSFRNNPKAAPALNLAYSDDTRRAFLQLEYLNLEGLPNNEFHTRYYDDGRVVASQVPENRRQWRYIAKAGLDWSLDSGNLFSVAAARDYELHIDRAQVPFIDLNTGHRERFWFWREKESTEYTNFTTYYKWQFAQPGHTLNLRAEYTRGKEDEAYFLNEVSNIRTGTDDTHIVADENALPVMLDYVRPLRFGRLETGLKYQRRWIPVTYDVVRGAQSVIYPGMGDWSDWDEDIYAGYLNLVRESERLDIETGLRIESTHVAYTIPPENIYYPGSDSYRYLELFPNLKLTWPVGARNSMLAAYNRRVDRPGEPHLRIFAKYDDPENLKVGNPYLRPQFTEVYELGLHHDLAAGSLSMSAFQRRITDAFIRIFAIDDSNPRYDIVNKIYHNVGRSRQTGLELTGSHRLGANAQLSGSINWYRTDIDAYDTVLYFPYTRPFRLAASSAHTWDFKLNSQWRLPAGFQLQTGYVYYAARNVAQGRELPRSSLDLTVKRTVLGDGELAFSATDVFDTLGYRHEARAPGVLSVYENLYETQVFGMALKFRF